MEAVPSDSSECEDNSIKKEKYKKQYGEKEVKEEYNKDKGKFKSSKTEKQLDINEVIEGFTDNEEVSLDGMNVVSDPVFVDKHAQHLR